LTLGSDNAEPRIPKPSLEGDEPGNAPTTEVAAAAASAATTEVALPAAKVSPGRFRRVLEWFTRGQALNEARAQVAASVKRPPFLLAAFSSLALANACLRGTRRRPADYVQAAEEGRRALIFALSALTPPSSETPENERAIPDVGALFDAAPGELLTRSAPAELLALVRADVTKHDFRTFSELSPADGEATARRLAAFATNVATALEEPQHRADKLVRQRFVRVGGTLLLLFTIVVAFATDLGVSFRDLADGKSFRASSGLGNGGCKSPAQSCPESPFFFFHTVDEDKPWIEIDLGKVTEFSELIVKNRSDCCADRAVPLIAEVSAKRSRWKTVARIDTTFDEWNPSFAPVEARYVRLKATRKTLLHLERVRVLP
jgi:hypothetical protein